MYSYSMNLCALCYAKNDGEIRDLNKQLPLIKKWGVDTVNFRTDFGVLGLNTHQYLYEIGEAVENHGFKFYVNFGGMALEKSRPQPDLTGWLNTWEGIAAKFPTGYFDVFHENRFQPDSQWRTWMQRVVNRIRRNSNSDIIVYPPQVPRWGSMDVLKNGFQVDDDKVWYAVTCLEGFWKGKTKEEQRQILKNKNIIWALNNGFKVTVADTGLGTQGGTDADIPAYKTFLELLTELEIPYNVWTWGTREENLIVNYDGVPSAYGSMVKKEIAGGEPLLPPLPECFEQSHINMCSALVDTDVNDPSFVQSCDVNRDGIIDIHDISFMAARLCPVAPPPPPPPAYAGTHAKMLPVPVLFYKLLSLRKKLIKEYIHRKLHPWI